MWHSIASIGMGIIIALALMAGLIASVFVGRWFGRKRSTDEHADDPHIGVVQGAILGLLGLLLGFSFSGASSRFVERQDILVREAGAIGTVYQRCDLLPSGVGIPLREALRAYTAARLELFQAAGHNADTSAALTARIRAAQDEVWRCTVRAIESQPQVTNVMVGAVGEIGDLLSARNAATRKHTPTLVILVMIACALASMGSVGYVLGLSGPPPAKPRPIRGPVILLAVLIAAVLWTIIDLDLTRHGLIQIDSQPLLELKDSMNAAPPAPPAPR